MDIDITNGIDVGGFHFAIDMSKTAQRSLIANGNSGECDCRNYIIFVDNLAPREQISKTFIHEVIEAVNYIYCDSKLEHEKIQQLSFGLHQALESLGIRFVGSDNHDDTEEE